MSYKVEELLALRDSVSESAVSIDRFADEDVIKEHVLRPSASACLIGAQPDNASRSAIAPAAVNATASTKKPSPSPSIKRGKAERLLKEHGSPPGMRVTAGGRVVPSDLPPLSNARFNSNNLRAQPPRGVSPGNLTAAQPSSDDNKIAPQAPGLFTHNGQAYLFIDNQLVPINNIAMGSTSNLGQNAGYGDPGRLFGDPNLLSVPPPMSGYLPQERQANAAPVSAATAPNAAFTVTDLTLLKQQHAAKKQEQKQLEQIEVLQGPQETEAWRANTIERKKALVIEIDNLRKSINCLEAKDAKEPKDVSMPTHSIPVAPNPAFHAPQFQQPMLSSMYPPVGFPMSAQTNTFAQAPYFMYGQPFAGPQFIPMGPSPFTADPRGFNPFENGLTPGTLTNPVVPTANAEHGGLVGRDSARQSPPGIASAMRRSCALEIKPPKDVSQHNNVARGSSLNPRSPTYEPAKPVSHGQSRNNTSFLPSTSSPGRTPDRMFLKSSQESMKNGKVVKEKSSFSSVSTADFFPFNTHEHSLTRAAPAKTPTSKHVSHENLNASSKHASRENLVTPITPEKGYSGSPWNSLPRSGGGSLTGAVAQSSPLRLWSGPFEVNRTESRRGSKATAESGGLTGVRRIHSDLAAETDNAWLYAVTTPAPTIPSTFQEGYQAGKAHVGIPSDPEVIRGFIDGLTAALNELNCRGANSRASSSRGTPFLPGCDSAVSLTFAASTNWSAIGKENNGRLATGSTLLTPAEESPLSPIGTRGIRLDTSEKAAEEKPATITSENGCRKEGFKAQCESPFSNMSFPRQLSGNQTGNRGMNTVSQLSTGPKDPGYAMKSTLPSMRPRPDQRYSGFDGAMDDLAELMPLSEETKGASFGDRKGTPSEGAVTEATCFGYSGKGKQKVMNSPTKSSGSPKKSGQQSPAKAKLEQLAGNLVGKCGPKDDEEGHDDPAKMSPEEKRRWREHWRKRFVGIGKAEEKEIRKTVQEQKQDRLRRSQYQY